jgi:NADPH:quinone reductase-like Zn-dependent oxidoreductase
VKAAYLTGHGGNEVVAVGERPQPVRGAGEVLVRLHAATVNRVDLYMRDSGADITHTLPMVMGLDGASVVEEIDADERMLQTGQRVLVHPGIACGRCEFCLRGDDTLCTSYGRGDVVQQVMAATDGREVDVVIENVGAAVWSPALKSLVRGGRLVVCGATTGDHPPADIRRIFIRQLQVLGSTMGDLGEFRDLLSLAQRSGLKPVIDSEYALDDVHGALDRLDSGKQFGEIVINIGSGA